MSSNDLQGYKIQGIYYLNKRTHRIQQNVGGACPLLALCNTLFLNHQINYNKGGRRIKFQELTDCLTQHLENMLDDSVDGKKVKTELQVDKEKNNENKKEEEEEEEEENTNLFGDDSHSHDDVDDVVDDDDDDDDDDMNIDDDIDDIEDDEKDKEDGNDNNDNNNDNNDDLEEKEAEKELLDKISGFEECIKLFPKLEEGLDINIKFSDACDFEENPGYRMFSYYGFKLYHGWVVDPQQNELYKLIGTKSYDETIDLLISDLDKNANDSEIKKFESDKEIIRKFFSESATQLTSYGLSRLYSLMDIEDELAIFFRNNHFSTIVKHAGILYEFVTDEGIVDADPQITWQTLLQISGDEQFVNNKFQSIHSNISQYTQIAQYNRMKFQQDNGITFGVDDVDDDDDKKKKEENKENKQDDNNENDKIIEILNNALDYIESQSFNKIKREYDDEDDIDPLLSHGLTQRTTDTVDRYICKDYIYGIPIINDKFNNIDFNIRCFEMNDARNILNLMSIAHESSYQHFKNIDFMHCDGKYALILESNNNDIIGCCKYEWMKLNFWDWRESDWEDYDIDNVYNISCGNTRYEKQKLLRESGVRSDYFIRILDIAILTNYAHKGLGSQLLQTLIYAFPSGTKFGVEVPATNTAAVKCFTKCGFTIARVEQSYGTKYKMTTESYFTLSQYQSFMSNSIVIIPKVINNNITSTAIISTSITTTTTTTTTATATATTTTTTPENNKKKTKQKKDDHDDDDDDDDEDDDDEDEEDEEDEDEEEEEDYHGISQNIQIPDAAMITPQRNIQENRHKIHGGYGGDTDDIDGNPDDYDDDSDHHQHQHQDQHHHQQHHTSIQQQEQHQQQHEEHEEHQHHSLDSGTGIDENHGDMLSNVGIQNLFGGSDSFVFNTLLELGLARWNDVFTEFNITKEALLHLDPSIVECMITQKNDRNKFIQWLSQYKQQENIDNNKPSKPPKQQSTDIETGIIGAITGDDTMAIDGDIN